MLNKQLWTAEKGLSVTWRLHWSWCTCAYV